MISLLVMGYSWAGCATPDEAAFTYDHLPWPRIISPLIYNLICDLIYDLIYVRIKLQSAVQRFPVANHDDRRKNSTSNASPLFCSTTSFERDFFFGGGAVFPVGVD